MTLVRSPATDWAIGVRVFLVEADPLTREVLSAALTDTGFEVHAEPDGSHLDRLLAFQPEIALLDVDLGNGVNASTVAQRLWCVQEVPFLFLTGARDIEDVLSGFDVRGADYVVKPFMMAELLARMHAVLRRTGRPGRNVLKVADLMIDVEAHRAVRAGYEISLTYREFTLLVALARHPGLVLSKAQLLTDVWGFEHHDLNVVEVHISAVRRKLEEHGPRLVHTVRGVGYVLRAKGLS